MVFTFSISKTEKICNKIKLVSVHYDKTLSLTRQLTDSLSLAP